MGSKKEAADCIRKIANIEDVKVLVCKVTSVTGRSCDVTPISGDAPIKKVRLNANITGTAGILITPVINSDVLVVMLSPVDSFVAMFSEIDSIAIDDGLNDGLIKINELTSKLNDLITQINALKSDYIAHTHPTPAGLSSAPTVPYTGTFSTFSKNDYENNKVKH